MSSELTFENSGRLPNEQIDLDRGKIYTPSRMCGNDPFTWELNLF
jgi:hypothetical protein